MTSPKESARLTVLPLEDRVVPAGLDTRSYDGSGNNAAHADWGQAGTDFVRIAAAAYADGVSAPAGAARPSARDISNALSDQAGQDIISDRDLSAMMYAWGQFIDHDLDLTKSGSTEKLNIAVPKGDPTFDPAGTGTATMSFTRSGYDAATAVRQQINTISTWLDGSMIYGSDATTAASLRTMSGGQMKTSSGGLLPIGADGFYQAGDVRANENPELTSIQTLFVREHNRLAAQFAKADPKLSDEAIYQKARAWVIAEIESITYNEWLPSLLGTPTSPYRGYDAKVNPGISNEFATAGFRLGHSMLGNDIEFLDNNGEEVREGVDLANAFFNPSLVAANGIDPLLKYLASDPSSEIDTKVVDGVRNLLLTSPGGSVTMDLASLNIQRGRDHGLADYNTTRAAYGLPKVTSFAQITHDPATQAKLKAMYGTVNNIDLWVGALAEDHVKGGSVGPLTRAILVDQFERLRSGDRFWYENTFKGPELQALRNTHLSDVIARNTALTTIQPNAFIFHASIGGTAFGDGNRDAKFNPGEPLLFQRTIQLVNLDTGEIVATKTTDPNGRYLFTVQDGLRTGRYTIRLSLLAGETRTTPADPVITVKGGDFAGTVDVGASKALQAPPPAPAPAPPPRPNGPSLAFDLPQGMADRPAPGMMPPPPRR